MRTSPYNSGQPGQRSACGRGLRVAGWTAWRWQDKKGFRRSFPGKSTVAASLANSLLGRDVSLDEIEEERGLHGGEGIPLSESARTNELARDRVITRLRIDQTVIVDDTSSPPLSAGRLAGALSSVGVPI